MQQIYETYLDICFSKWMTICSKVYSLVQLSAEVFDENISSNTSALSFIFSAEVSDSNGKSDSVLCLG